MNPYESLRAATTATTNNPDEARAASPTINEDRNLTTTLETPLCESGTLIKSPNDTAEYYCSADSKRYVFPNQRVFNTWYESFSTVQTIPQEQLPSIPLGGNVTFRPGTKLVKIQTDPKVYAVARGGVLRWVTSSAIANSLYGTSWEQKLETTPDYLFTSYRVGESISSTQ